MSDKKEKKVLAALTGKHEGKNYAIDIKEQNKGQDVFPVLFKRGAGKDWDPQRFGFARFGHSGNKQWIDIVMRVIELDNKNEPVRTINSQGLPGAYKLKNDENGKPLFEGKARLWLSSGAVTKDSKQEIQSIFNGYFLKDNVIGKIQRLKSSVSEMTEEIEDKINRLRKERDVVNLRIKSGHQFLRDHGLNIIDPEKALESLKKIDEAEAKNKAPSKSETPAPKTTEKSTKPAPSEAPAAAKSKKAAKYADGPGF